MDKLPSIVYLIKQLQQIPYLASKNMYRIVDYILSMPAEKSAHLCAAIVQAQENIKRCEICWSWKEAAQECWLCHNPKRDQSTICVVETWQELLSIERTGGFTGLYHVLGGAISPLDGIDVQSLTIDKLLLRINETVKEVILATNQTPEGEATAAYIASKLRKFDLVRITCLARGVPVGSMLDGMDRLTVYKALSERRSF